MKHQRIIVFSENIENLYAYIALILFVSDTFITCCLGFIIVTVSRLENHILVASVDNPMIIILSLAYISIRVT